jgi:N-alpha-acetyltransferase 40
MKSKDLKLLRKKLAQVNKLSLDLLQVVPSELLHISFSASSSPSTTSSSNPHADSATSTANTLSELSLSNEETKVIYLPSSKMTPGQLQQCLDLFQENMSKLYQESSWGLNLEEKKEELQHANARFLLLQQQQQQPKESSSTSIMVAFVHFRFEYDDEEHPTCAVLYVYELQVQQHFHGQGLGRKLMDILHAIAKAQDMPKVVLTVFHANIGARKFYDKLGYTVDETSPSQFGQREDYEILSFKL